MDAFPRYAFRTMLFCGERAFTLTPEGLLVGRRTIVYHDFDRMRLYQVRAQDGSMIDRCKLHAGRTTVLLQSAHVAGVGRIQDRKAQYELFLHDLTLRIAHANPTVSVLVGMPWQTRAGWRLTLVLVVVLGMGGLALLMTGDWSGLWLIGFTLGTAPLALAMATKKPARLVGIATISASNGFRDLLN